MSHFSLIVLLPKGTVDVKTAVGELLHPYDENTEVPEREAACHCVGMIAEQEAGAEAIRVLFGATNLREVGESWRKRHPEFQAADRTWNSLAYSGAWALEVRRPLDEATAQGVARHPLNGKPDPTCGFYSGERAAWWPEGAKEGDRHNDGSGCAGTGRVTETANPNGKWDGFQIGGRWTGAMCPDYKPEKDPANIETCHICGGTGRRDDRLGREERERNPEYTCNGCQGKGEAVKWPTQWRSIGGDILPVNQIPSDFAPCATVTPDGKWHETGGTWTHKKTSEESRVAFRAITNDFLDHLAVIVDCHT